MPPSLNPKGKNMDHNDKAAKSDYDLHCLLIMKAEGVSKSKAQFMAWCEGEGGLAKRLGQGALPFQQEKSK